MWSSWNEILEGQGRNAILRGAALGRLSICGGRESSRQCARMYRFHFQKPIEMHLQFRKGGDVFNVEIGPRIHRQQSLLVEIGLLKELYRLLRQGLGQLP